MNNNKKKQRKNSDNQPKTRTQDCKQQEQPKKKNLGNK
jgi:hypothetical protein